MPWRDNRRNRCLAGALWHTSRSQRARSSLTGQPLHAKPWTMVSRVISASSVSVLSYRAWSRSSSIFARRISSRNGHERIRAQFFLALACLTTCRRARRSSAAFASAWRSASERFVLMASRADSTGCVGDAADCAAFVVCVGAAACAAGLAAPNRDFRDEEVSPLELSYDDPILFGATFGLLAPAGPMNICLARWKLLCFPSCGGATLAEVSFGDPTSFGATVGLLAPAEPINICLARLKLLCLLPSFGGCWFVESALPLGDASLLDGLRPDDLEVKRLILACATCCNGSG